MEIKDKNAFEYAVRSKIEKFVIEFPFHFHMNIFINIVLLFIMTIFIALGTLSMISSSAEGAGVEAAYYFFILAMLSLPIIKTTFSGFLRNLRILRNVAKGQYKFEIERHEMDNAIEFIEDFPMKEEDVQRSKVSLSFGKIIEVMEAARIISSHKKIYDLDPIFRNEIRHTLGEKIEESGYKEKAKDTYGKDWRIWR